MSFTRYNKLKLKMTGLVDEELISHLPNSLKYICHNGAGYDQVDAEACAKKGKDGM